MIKSIETNQNKNNWINYKSCCNIMLLSSSGWYLSPLFKNNITPYVQCRYCNKCISLQSYDYKKMLSLLPENFGKPNFNNSFLNAINEDSEHDQDEKNQNDDNIIIKYNDNDENKEEDKEEDEDEEMEEDISTILNRELPTNDTESLMNQLSKLGLKINSNITRHHQFQVYETKSLQRQAYFNSDDINNNNKNNNHRLSNFNISSGFGSFTNFNNSMQMSCSQ